MPSVERPYTSWGEGENEYTEGWDAFVAGRPILECPYKPSSKRAEKWRRGWKAAEAEKGNG